MQYKICSKCKSKLPADAEHFYKDKHAKDGFRPDCKKCCKKQAENRKAEKSAYMKRYRDSHKEELKENHRHWREENRELR